MKKAIIIQAIALVFVFGIIYLLYPKTNLEVSGNVVKVDSNADTIIVSKYSDFLSIKTIYWHTISRHNLLIPISKIELSLHCL